MSFLSDNEFLAESIPGILIELNLDFEIQYVDSGIEQVGYQPSTLDGKPFATLIHPDDHSKLNQQLESLDVSESIDTQLRFLPANGDEYPAEQFRLRNVNFKRPADASGTIFGVLHDPYFTDVDQSELALKNRAMDSISEGAVIARAEGKDNPLVYINEGFLNITGYSRDEVLGRDCRFLQGPETSDENISKIRQAITNEEPIMIDIINYKKSGEPFYNRLSITPIRNQSGAVTHYAGIQNDVTELKEQQEQLRQAEKLTAVGQMAAGVMHEINNPNAVIKGNINFLKEAWDRVIHTAFDSEPEDSQAQFYLEELDDTLDEIERSSARIEKIVEKVELFTRKESRDDHEPIDPRIPIRNAIKTFGDEDQKNIEIDFNETGDHLPTVQGNAFEVQQLVTNLIENAIYATKSQENPEILVRGEWTSDDFTLEIADNGTGIVEHVLDNIFDPFFTTKPPGKGTGLGMSIVKGIVERMEGELTVDTEPGEGTSFKIEFPTDLD